VLSVASLGIGGGFSGNLCYLPIDGLFGRLL
jgi:hypothetical protein